MNDMGGARDRAFFVIERGVTMREVLGMGYKVLGARKFGCAAIRSFQKKQCRCQL